MENKMQKHEIRTAEHLDEMALYKKYRDENNNIVGHFLLMNDIDLGNIDGISNLIPIGTEEHKFKGIFDGQGYTICNLEIDRPDTSHVGLFGYAEGKDTVIKNLNIVKADVKGKDNVGIIAGKLEGGAKLEACTTKLASVTITPIEKEEQKEEEKEEQE